MLFEGPHKMVRDLADFNMDYSADGREVRRHRGHVVLYRKQSWALLLAAYQLNNHGRWSPTEYRLQRMRWAGGHWHAQSHMNVKGHHLNALFELGPQFLAEHP